MGSGIARKSSSDLTANGATVTAPAGYYSSNATKTISSGTEGTPTASKGSVSNHAISVTPSVTNTAGYISGGTKTGTAVSVTASELVSGTLSISQNGTADVTNYASVNVSVSGGGGSDVAEDQVDTELESNSYTLTFTGLQGEPTSFVVMYDDGMSVPSSTPYRAISIVYDGTDVHAQTLTNTNNAQVSYDGSNFSKSYSNGTLTITSTGAEFISGWWVMSYTYGGTAGNINTANVQVGSGATSITFTGLEDEPLCWSCIFKSNFSTSNGYQRVIAVRKRNQDGAGVNIYGFAMDSSAHGFSAYWSESYNNGSLTITSQGTNNGGYFHQPGYYQLTYAVTGSSGNYQSKTVTPSSSTQIVQADEGYEALSKVTVNPIPSSYVQPTATKGATTYTPGTSNQTIASGTYLTGTQTISGDANLVAGNIKSGTTIFGVTGTYSGGGGGSANIGTETTTNSSNQNTSISFTQLSGQPKAFFVRLTSQMARSSGSRYYYVENIRWNGSSTGGVEGRQFYMYNGTLTNVTSGYSYSYSNNTLTLTSTGSRSAAPGSFYNGTYELIYIY